MCWFNMGITQIILDLPPLPLSNRSIFCAQDLNLKNGQEAWRARPFTLRNSTISINQQFLRTVALVIECLFRRANQYGMNGQSW